jgi:thiol-disulfide isomerase/thioredoxin
MQWKLILILVVAAAVVGYLGYNFFYGSTQGFQNPSEDTFTMFYADWCPHCKTAKPDFKNWMDQGPVKVGSKSVKLRMVEQGADKAGEMKKKKVQGFPTFLLETTDGQVVEHKGSRSTEGYLKFLNATLGGGV